MSQDTTRNRILQSLLHAEEPLRADHLTTVLGISRNATYQHLLALERDRLIEKTTIIPTKGRPCHTFRLTELGRETFPRNYSLLAKLLISLVKSRMGSDQLGECLEELGASLADDFRERVSGLAGQDLIAGIANIMQELGYEAEMVLCEEDQKPEIRANNCVFHLLASEHEEVCSLDLSLISQLSGQPFEQTECMVRGGTCCRFRAKPSG